MPEAASPDTALGVDAAAFRSLMGQFATGVCVVSAAGPDGEALGITVNSFVSVSLDPMLVSWSLHNSASQFDVWAGAGAYSISILAADQQETALRYASRKGIERVPADFASGPSGVPHIAGALGYLECRPWKNYPAGDHTLILGEVSGLYRAGHEDIAGAGMGGAGGRPLLFFGSAFRQIGD